MNSPIAITLAAIEYGGVIYTGKRHHLIIKDMVNSQVPGGAKRFHNQGFVTNEGEYLNRKEAARIALLAGQIEKLSYSEDELFSEEVIPL